jgi:integrase/recombinase XerC
MVTERTGASKTASPAQDRLLTSYTEYLTTQPQRTGDAYLRDLALLTSLAGSTAIIDVSTPLIRRFLAVLHARGLSTRTLARVLSGWRAFYRFAIEHESTLKANPCGDVKPPKSVRRLPSALSPDEAVALVAIDATDSLSIRDRALLELAYSSGLRVSELAGLDIEALDLDAGEVRVMGKGSKERIVPVGRGACSALNEWLNVRSAVPQAEARAVFLSRTGRRLTSRAIEQRLALWSKKRGLSRHVHPHMLRHSFASHLLQSSGDLRAVQELLGHASIASTQIYTHLDFQYLAKIYDQSHPRAKKK